MTYLSSGHGFHVIQEVVVPGIVTLTTDFGARDAYVGAMKGVMLAIDPALALVDISHEIGAHDVMEAAFVLRSAAPCFPEGTVHLVVVDPGVGTERRPLACRIGGQLFVGPDNGLFTLLATAGETIEAIVLDRPEFWRCALLSSTFHGRDLFAPVAAHLATGRALEEVGSPAGAIRRLHWVEPVADEQGIRGWVAHVDRFGNAITNIPRDIFEHFRRGRALKCYVGAAIVTRLCATYGEAAPGEPLLLFGSEDLLEIAVHGGSAQEQLDIVRGAAVTIVFAPPG